MGLFGDIFESAINYCLNKLGETSRAAGKEISKNLFQERIEKELSERAAKNKALNLLVEFRNTHDRCEFAEFLLFGMYRKFGLDDEISEVSDDDYLRTFRGIQYGDKKNPISAMAFYKNQQLLIAGRINERFFGISVTGKNSYTLCCYISKFVIHYETVEKYSVIDDLQFYDKKIYILAEQLVKNPTQDDSIFGGIEEFPENDLEDEDDNFKEDEENEENYEDEDDEEVEEEEGDDTENEITELCNFFKIEYSSLNKTVLKKSYYNMMTLYHPDKVHNLADDFRELAEKKTKEINEKYESLLALLEQKGKS